MLAQRLAIVLVLAGFSSCRTVEKEAEDINASTGAEVWAQAGALAFPEAARKMQANNPPAEYLSLRDRQALRFAFGNLVDQVRVHWNSVPLNEWASQQYGVQPVGEDASAQTYGFDIYVRYKQTDWADADRLEMLVHEMVHVDQFQRYGNSMSDFGYHYFREYFNANQVYAENALEKEAQTFVTRNLTFVIQKYQKP